ncbi:hypothetical protein XH79_01225 [Bradyrhizobium sp. CCBAU 45389]|nr:hypothetical protein [Bradyrhizobium sp. CCBAU 45389]
MRLLEYLQHVCSIFHRVGSDLSEVLNIQDELVCHVSSARHERSAIPIDVLWLKSVVSTSAAEYWIIRLRG